MKTTLFCFMSPRNDGAAHTAHVTVWFLCAAYKIYLLT